MRSLFLSVLVLAALSFCATAQAQILYSENFDDLAHDQKGATGVDGVTTNIDLTGVTNWSIDVSSADLADPNDHFRVDGQVFEGRDTGGEAIWESILIDISSEPMVAISLEAIENGDHEPSDYFDFSYSVDGGTFTLVTNWNEKGSGIHTLVGDLPDDGDWLAETVKVFGVTGTSLVLRVAMFNGAGTEFIQLDNVLVDNAIAPTNIIPVVTVPGPIEVNTSNTVLFTVTAGEPDGDAITLSTNGTPANSAFYATNGTGSADGAFEFTPTLAQSGSVFNVDFIAEDKDGASTGTVTITVLGPPEPGVFISEVADPSDVGAAGRFVELYNPTAGPIDLSAEHWVLARQANGGGFANITLTGTIPANGTYVIANNAVNHSTTYGSAADQASGSITGTGNDGYFLYKNGGNPTGTLVDAYGVLDEDGTGQPWEYTDGQAERNSNITIPNKTWTAGEWTITITTAASGMTPGVHIVDGVADLPPNISINPGNTTPTVVVSNEYKIVVTAIQTSPSDTGDVTTVSSTNLPVGAIYTPNPAVGTAPVTNTFCWTPDATQTGVTVVTFSAGDKDGTNNLSVTFMVEPIPIPSTNKVWINEVDYDPVGTDSNEWIELVGEAGLSLDDFELLFISGSSIYASNDLADASFTFVDQQDGLGFFVLGSVSDALGVNADYTPAGWGNNEIQNGPADSIQLREKVGALNAHTIDYEGNNAGTLTEDQVIDLADTDDAETSLYLTGGPGMTFSAFDWTNTVGSATPGEINDGQNFIGGGGGTDTNSNGIADAWELIYCAGDCSPVTGPTGDGDDFSWIDEYLLDYDPTVSNEAFTMESIAQVNSQDLTFGATTNTRNYKLEANTDLPNNPWVLVDVQAGSNGVTTITDPSNDPNRSYRIQVSVP